MAGKSAFGHRFRHGEGARMECANALQGQWSGGEQQRRNVVRGGGLVEDYGFVFEGEDFSLDVLLDCPGQDDFLQIATFVG